MKLEVGRYGLSIVPESDVEVAWIEEVLNLKSDGESVALVRENRLNSGSIAHLTTNPLKRVEVDGK